MRIHEGQQRLNKRSVIAIINDCAVENKEIEEIMEKLEDGDTESMLMNNMLIKTTVDGIILFEIIHLSNQVNAYRESISLNMLNLANDKVASLANLENVGEAMREKWKSWKSNPKETREQESFVIFRTIMGCVNNN